MCTGLYGISSKKTGIRRTRGKTLIPFGTPWLPRDKGPSSWYPCLAVDLGHLKPDPDPHDPPSVTPGMMSTPVPHTAVTQSGIPQLPRTGNPASWVSRIDTHPVARTTA